MLPFLLIGCFVLLLGFGGYTSDWELFDLWWSGGAVVCSAFLLYQRPIRFHVLGYFLLPALAVLIFPHVLTSAVVKNGGWWVISLYVFLVLPTFIETESASETLFKALRWCGAVLTILYAIQKCLHLPVHGFGFAKSSESQILLGSVACCLFIPCEAGRTWKKYAWLLVLGTGICLNESRSALLGAGILVAGYFWVRRVSVGWIIGVALVSLAAVITLTHLRMETDPHAELRLNIFVQAVQIFTEFPFGSGMGTFLTESLSRSFPILDPQYLSQYAKVNNHAHNILLQWAAEGGIVGMATAMSVVLCAWVLLIQKWRRHRDCWPLAAAVIWCPAFVLELMINVTESLSPIRWMGLVGITALTAEYSVILLKKSNLLFRFAMILIGGGLMFAGINDLFARQAIRIGINMERQEKWNGAMESYQEAHRRRPWDEQPLLHIAHVALPMGRIDLMESSIERALKCDEGQGAARYHGAKFYLEYLSQGMPDKSNQAIFQKSRYLMFSVNDLQPYDVPAVLDGAAWSRNEAEKKWRLHRALSLEPRAARAYEALANLSAGEGDKRHAEMFSTFAGQIRRYYRPAIIRGLEKYSPLDLNVSRYEIRLIQ